MRVVSGWIRATAVACLGLCLVGSASAAVIINVVQSGSDVVLSMSGSLSNLGTDGSQYDSNDSSRATIGVIRDFFPDKDFFRLAKGGITNVTYYNKTSGPGLAWGNSRVQSSSSSFTSSLNFFLMGNEGLTIDSSYVFGTAITGSATFNNKTLAGLGLTNQGSYVYTYGSGSNSDTVTFNIGGSGGGGGGQVPEPTSMAIFGLGALGLAYRARRKAKA